MMETENSDPNYGENNNNQSISSSKSSRPYFLSILTHYKVQLIFPSPYLLNPQQFRIFLTRHYSIEPLIDKDGQFLSPDQQGCEEQRECILFIESLKKWCLEDNNNLQLLIQSTTPVPYSNKQKIQSIQLYDNEERNNTRNFPFSFSGGAFDYHGQTLLPSLLRILLNVPSLQLSLILLILERIYTLSETDQSTSTDTFYGSQNHSFVLPLSSSTSSSLPRQLLSQLRYLDRTYHSILVATKMLEYAVALIPDHPSLAKEIISAVSEVVDDSAHSYASQKLLELMQDHTALTLPVLDSLSSLRLTEEGAKQIITSVLPLLHSVPLTDIPILLKFILKQAKIADVIDDVLTAIRDDRALVQPSDIFSASQSQRGKDPRIDEEKLTGPLLIISSLKSTFHSDPTLSLAYLKLHSTLTSLSSHCLVDVWLLFILHSLRSYTQKVETLLKRKILLGQIDSNLITSAMSSNYANGLVELYDTILNLASTFMRHNEEKVARVGKEIYSSLFSHFTRDSHRGRVIECLIVHVGSRVAHEVNFALLTLQSLTRPHLISSLANYLQPLKTLLDCMEDLTIPQIRILFQLYCTLTVDCYNPTNPIKDNKLLIFMRKNMDSGILHYQRIGIIGTIQLLIALAPSTHPNHSPLPSAAVHEFSNQLSILDLCCNHRPVSFVFVFDELTRVIKERLFHIDAIRLIDGSFSDYFLTRFSSSSREPGLEGSDKVIMWGLEKEEDMDDEDFDPPIILISPSLLSSINNQSSVRRTASLILLCPSFRLLIACKENIAVPAVSTIYDIGVLGAPLLMPNQLPDDFHRDDLISHYQTMTDDEKKLHLSALFHVLNWMRELLNVWGGKEEECEDSTERRERVKEKTTKRLIKMIKLESQFNTILTDLLPPFTPAQLLGMDIATQPAVITQMKLMEGTEVQKNSTRSRKGRKVGGIKKKVPRKTKGKKRKKKQSNGDSSSTSTSDSEEDSRSKKNASSTKASSAKMRKGGGMEGNKLEQFQPLLRELSLSVSHMLTNPLLIEGQTQINQKKAEDMEMKEEEKNSAVKEDEEKQLNQQLDEGEPPPYSLPLTSLHYMLVDLVRKMRVLLPAASTLALPYLSLTRKFPQHAAGSNLILISSHTAVSLCEFLISIFPSINSHLHRLLAIVSILFHTEASLALSSIREIVSIVEVILESALWTHPEHLSLMLTLLVSIASPSIKGKPLSVREMKKIPLHVATSAVYDMMRLILEKEEEIDRAVQLIAIMHTALDLTSVISINSNHGEKSQVSSSTTASAVKVSVIEEDAEVINRHTKLSHDAAALLSQSWGKISNLKKSNVSKLVIVCVHHSKDPFTTLLRLANLLNAVSECKEEEMEKEIIEEGVVDIYSFLNGTLQAKTIHLFLLPLLEELISLFSNFITTREDPSKSASSYLTLYQKYADSMVLLLKICRTYESPNILAAALVSGRRYVNLAIKSLSSFNKIFSNLSIGSPNETLLSNVIKSVQFSTRSLQIICTYGKTKKISSITNKIPMVRGVLERWIYSVKELFVKYGWENMFTQGVLKNKGLDGKEIQQEEEEQEGQAESSDTEDDSTGSSSESPEEGGNSSADQSDEEH